MTLTLTKYWGISFSDEAHFGGSYGCKCVSEFFTMCTSWIVFALRSFILVPGVRVQLLILFAREFTLLVVPTASVPEWLNPVCPESQGPAFRSHISSVRYRFNNIVISFGIFFTGSWLVRRDNVFCHVRRKTIRAWREAQIDELINHFYLYR